VCSGGTPKQLMERPGRQLPTRMYSAALFQMGLVDNQSALPDLKGSIFFLPVGMVLLPAVSYLLLCFFSIHVPDVRHGGATWEPQCLCRVHHAGVPGGRGSYAW
jgi:hypothetical protein